MFETLKREVCQANLELVKAGLASETLRLQPRLKPVAPALLDTHFLRKHGARATYGQASP